MQQKPHSLAAQHFFVDHNCRQGRLTETRRRDVIEAHDRDVLRNAQALPAARLQGGERRAVIEGEDGVGTGRQGQKSGGRREIPLVGVHAPAHH